MIKERVKTRIIIILAVVAFGLGTLNVYQYSYHQAYRNTIHEYITGQHEDTKKDN